MTRRSLLVSAAAVVTASCSYNEELGPSELLFVSLPQMARLARPVWAEILKRETLSKNEAHLARAKTIASKIITASHNTPSDWEVAVFATDTVSAFALPNRKIGIYAGLLDQVDDDQLSAVLAGAVAHVNYNHFGERYARSALANNGLTTAQISAAARGHPEQIRALFGVSSAPGEIVPFSREHALAADKFAVRYMTRAGYDAIAAVRLWRGLAARQGGEAPALLLVHPVDATRMKKLSQEIDLLRNQTRTAPDF